MHEDCPHDDDLAAPQAKRVRFANTVNANDVVHLAIGNVHTVVREEGYWNS
jgi:hypothetical protein